ncbi:MAG: hypothetical protein A3F14_00525 [Gammaproteobacteria bacterium RIFCSPHIGHO2_12_FULL_43_28]|nr:MAG: hypothetical protein A3F14_00525 [Gammaproteobacteria bacterium RIFCSPHIGHO2_12_FULL_43_28]
MGDQTMLKKIRRAVVNQLWESYRANTPHAALIENGLAQKGLPQLYLDHFAIIDLPGPHTGIPCLRELFEALGFIAQGRGYLPDKQNDFLWLSENDSFNTPARLVLPQVVIADFRLQELPTDVRNIILQYASLATPLSLTHIKELAQQATQSDEAAAETLIEQTLHYLTGRDWPLPTVAEFKTVQAFNELLAWVLVFGRRPNHFTLSVHLYEQFSCLLDFNHFIEHDMQLTLNNEGGHIKGNEANGIAQSSTEGEVKTIELADGTINLPTGFVEFVWRYQNKERTQQTLPETHWDDYFTGFVAAHANHVIESLYVNEQIKLS